VISREHTRAERPTVQSTRTASSAWLFTATMTVASAVVIVLLVVAQ